MVLQWNLQAFEQELHVPGHPQPVQGYILVRHPFLPSFYSQQQRVFFTTMRTILAIVDDGPVHVALIFSGPSFKTSQIIGCYLSS